MLDQRPQSLEVVLRPCLGLLMLSGVQLVLIASLTLEQWMFGGLSPVTRDRTEAAGCQLSRSVHVRLSRCRSQKWI